jgi:hypothetical protein
MSLISPQNAAADRVSLASRSATSNGEYSGPPVGLEAYCKPPISYVSVGFIVEAERALNWCVGNYMTQGGHFAGPRTPGRPFVNSHIELRPASR